MTTTTTTRPLMAATGTPTAAADMALAGADVVVAYHSSVYRERGIPSVAGLLPWANANRQTLHMLAGITAAAVNIPVLATVCANDHLFPVGKVLPEVRDRGARGVVNAPTVGLFTGPVREALEANGLGQDTEIALIAHAHDCGLQSWSYVFDGQWTRRALEAGADGIIIHLGLTGDSDLYSQQFIADECLTVITEAAATVPVLLHGGSLRQPSDFTDLLGRLTSCATLDRIGFFGASAFENAPDKKSPGEAIRSWRDALDPPGARS